VICGGDPNFLKYWSYLYINSFTLHQDVYTLHLLSLHFCDKVNRFVLYTSMWLELLWTLQKRRCCSICVYLSPWCVANWNSHCSMLEVLGVVRLSQMTSLPFFLCVWQWDNVTSKLLFIKDHYILKHLPVYFL